MNNNNISSLSNDKYKLVEIKNEEDYNLCLFIRRIVFHHEQQVPITLEVDPFDKHYKRHFILYENKTKQAIATARYLFDTNTGLI